MRVAFEITTPRPPAEVFAYVSDLRHLPAWYPGMDRAELVGGEAGQRDARYVLTAEHAVFPNVAIDYTTTATEPDRRVAFAYDHARMNGTESYELTPTDDGGTVVAFRSDASYKGISKISTPMAALMLKTVQRPAAKALRAALAA